jgi:uncharacterized protein YndB with AHSA1/START domain
MTTKNSNLPADTANREIILTRVFDAPRELVWEAFTNPRHVVNWWGPNGFTTTIETMDVRPGGVWKHRMRGPDGVEYPNKSVFKEVVKPERLVFSHGGGRADDGPGINFIVTWSFEAVGKQTKVTGHMVFPSPEMRERVVKEFGAIEGGKQHLARLAEYLSKMGATTEEFVLTREFDAPRDLVWKAFTDPAHMKNWWGPKGFTVRAANMDFRPGGTYHYGLRSPDGHDMWGKFVYREITPPERIVFINSFSDENGGVTRHPMNPNWPKELLSTFTFAERNGKTLFTIRWVPYNATDEERQTFEKGRPSMTQGWTGTLDQLAAYLPGIVGGKKS